MQKISIELTHKLLAAAIDAAYNTSNRLLSERMSDLRDVLMDFEEVIQLLNSRR